MDKALPLLTSYEDLQLAEECSVFDENSKSRYKYVPGTLADREQNVVISWSDTVRTYLATTSTAMVFALYDSHHGNAGLH